MSDQAAQREGFPRALGMGNLQLSYLHSLLRQFIGVDGKILRLEVQFRNPNLRGQVLTANGVITAIAGDQLSIELWTQSEDGSRLALGTAEVCRTR